MSENRCPRCGWQITTLPVPAACPVCAAPLGHAEPPPPESGPLWRMLGEDGIEYGPVTKAELDQWLREGRISARCKIAAGPQAPWLPAGEIYPQLQAAPRPGTAPLVGTPPASGSERQLVVAILLAVLTPFTGLCGLHRFYTGHIGIGLIQLLTFGGCGIWQLIDIILLASGSYKDADGRPLV